MSKIGISEFQVKRVASAMNRLPALDGFAIRLGSQDVRDACAVLGHTDVADIWTAEATFNVSLAGALSRRASLWGGLDHVEGLLAVGVPACESLRFKQSSAVYTARTRLPEKVFSFLGNRLVERLREPAERVSRWHGHTVFIVDGTGISMPDTEANTAGFGKHQNQHGQSAFPVGQMVALIHNRSHVVRDFRIGGLHNNELDLAAEMWAGLPPHSLVLGDSNFFGAWRLWQLHRAGHSFVVELKAHVALKNHGLTRVASRDHDFEYQIPHAARVAHPELPQSLRLRLIEVKVPSREKPGETEILYLVTNLMDRATYKRTAIANLFRERWHVEQGYFQIKILLQGDVLRGLTPDTVRKELICRVIAHNLICGQRLAAARPHRRRVDRVSYVGARDRTLTAQAAFQARPEQAKTQLQRDLLLMIADDQVPFRPGRNEPRARKRNPKPFSVFRGKRSARKKAA